MTATPRTQAVAALRGPLRAGAEALGWALTEAQLEALLDYLELIAKWNRVYNLTAVREPAEMLTHHVLDSLAVVGPLRRQLQAQGLAGPRRVLDVGSGAGLPGVVLALCAPELEVSCVDTVAKKAAFIQQAAVALRLPNLRGLHARVETLSAARGQAYDVVTSRAFASLSDFTRWSRAALAEGGFWMAMKGRVPDDEIAALPPEVSVFHVERLTVPGLDAERCIVWMRPASLHDAALT
ncbi:16S rRNA m(7)G-527 methyltransferase [Tibeticola sediminis]|uniref:Ribosomal RNA small subunit methyltransferase G n=1 Tax=Tibeticola sediminis TaxID=1917811 RepID=A0A3N4UZ67_9BURK|nr:16S rRNA (guanine(527)-N(7))-methyltransferase RsmG [Tibeticola sediminis]RPE66870.1 16S rRNA m(7)G-527 methyltransferase [Tibeticola sediminis]